MKREKKVDQIEKLTAFIPDNCWANMTTMEMMRGTRSIGFVNICPNVTRPADFWASNSELIDSNSDCTCVVPRNHCNAAK